MRKFLFVLLLFLFCVSSYAENKIVHRETIINATITAGNRLTVFAGGKTRNTKIKDGGIEDIFYGAVSHNARVFKGGKLWLAGGKSYGAIIYDGGLMEVREHDKKSSYSANTKLLSGARMNVFNHSLAKKITVQSNGFLRVYNPKAVISDVTILSGGLVHVWKHGTAKNVYIAPGGVLELREESPVLKGTIRVAGQLKTIFNHQPDVRLAKIIIDLTKRKTSDVYYIENLDFLSDAAISVNIAQNQKTGSYKFASGASRWKNRVDIMVGNYKAGTIAMWQPVKIHDKYYTLRRVNQKFIELEVSSTPPDPATLMPEQKISPQHKRKNNKRKEKKLTPTLEENLTPAQVARKIAVYRGRIVNAPEKQIPAKYKPELLEAFDDMASTKIGRYILEKAHPNAWFTVRDISQGAFYNHGSKEICINTRVYREGRNLLETREHLAQTMLHELTHSVQDINRMNDKTDMSLEEKVTIGMLVELQPVLIEPIFSEQWSQLPKYRHIDHYLGPRDLFYKDLKEAKMATGADENTAERFARTKFAEALWSGQKKAIRVGNKNISPSDLFIKGAFYWNQSYSNHSSGVLVGNKLPPHLAMKDRGIAQNIRRFTKAMGIDTSPSFFRDPKTTTFDVPDSKTMLCYAGGIKASEVRALAVGGRIAKRYSYKQKGRLTMIMPRLVEKKGPDGNRSYTEFHEGTNIKRATYTYRNGKMDGIYREYDREGKQISEIPFENGKMKGNGWVIENGKRVLKRFGGYTVRDRER